MKRCLDVAGSTHTSLKQMQQLLGSVNDLGQMSPTVKFHKIVGNDFLASFEGNYHIIRMVPERLKKELEVIAKVAEGAHCTRGTVNYGETSPALSESSGILHGRCGGQLYLEQRRKSVSQQ